MCMGKKIGATTLRALGKSHAPMRARGKRIVSYALAGNHGHIPHTRAHRTPLRGRQIEKGGKRRGRLPNLQSDGGQWNPRRQELESGVAALRSPSSHWFLCSTSSCGSTPLKASRPLIQILVINDNVCRLMISFEMMSIGWSMDEWGFIVIMQSFGDNVLSMSSRQRYNIGIFISPVIRCLVDEK